MYSIIQGMFGVWRLLDLKDFLGRGGAMLKALGYYSEGNEFKSQHRHTLTVGSSSKTFNH